MQSPFAERSQKEMRDVLMSPKAEGPKIHYYMIRGGADKKNITIWESGTVGGEYIKTYGHYHVDNLSETYEILAGEGIVILQKRAVGADGKPIDDEIVEFSAIKVKVGDKVFIPSGYGHLAVNTGKSWLVTKDDSPVNFGEKNAVANPGHADYAPFKKLHGAAYYIVEKKPSAFTAQVGGIAEFEFIKNPRYKKVPPVEFK